MLAGHPPLTAPPHLSQSGSCDTLLPRFPVIDFENCNSEKCVSNVFSFEQLSLNNPPLKICRRPGVLPTFENTFHLASIPHDSNVSLATRWIGLGFVFLPSPRVLRAVICHLGSMPSPLPPLPQPPPAAVCSCPTTTRRSPPWTGAATAPKSPNGPTLQLTLTVDSPFRLVTFLCPSPSGFPPSPNDVNQAIFFRSSPETKKPMGLAEWLTQCDEESFRFPVC